MEYVNHISYSFRKKWYFFQELLVEWLELLSSLYFWPCVCLKSKLIVVQSVISHYFIIHKCTYIYNKKANLGLKFRRTVTNFLSRLDKVEKSKTHVCCFFYQGQKCIIVWPLELVQKYLVCRCISIVAFYFH